MHRPLRTFALTLVALLVLGSAEAADSLKIGFSMPLTGGHIIVGDVKFADNGEWKKPRILFVQYQGVVGTDVAQFRKAGTQVILYPPELKSGTLIHLYSDIER